MIELKNIEVNTFNTNDLASTYNADFIYDNESVYLYNINNVYSFYNLNLPESVTYNDIIDLKIIEGNEFGFENILYFDKNSEECDFESMLYFKYINLTIIIKLNKENTSEVDIQMRNNIIDDLLNED